MGGGLCVFWWGDWGMRIGTGNLLANLPSAVKGEVFTPLVAGTDCRLLRIVSDGQATPEGEWYDQPEDEWVVVLSGAATVRIAGEDTLRALFAGDWLHLPAHCRHRVEATSHPTVWLVLHYQSAGQ